ncbi:LamG domain-containing protein [Aporhodopirellula aestuarii]|uniref:LamG domain-containing protein n=1 Tax=Aporhodopirellula aestuarii TaxID=2950107 RepID=A0ABT0TYS0_9BACT|nr:LamG domain-containing protein [Aporhodopirellula aestuarii]MCM2369753.1 LamG domain-containing protein [Aporhodopirellula aestuarii]
MPMPPDAASLTEFNDLVDRYCAGLLDRESFDKLESILRSSGERRRQFRETMSTHAALNEIADMYEIDQTACDLSGVSLSNVMQQDSPTAGVFPADQRTPSSSHRSTWLAVAVACAASLVISFLFVHYHSDEANKTAAGPDTSVPAQVAENSTQAVRHMDSLLPPTRLVSNRSIALIKSAVDVNWGPSSTPLRVGEVVPSHSVHFESGILEIVFLSGAMMVVEGPAKLDLVSVDKAILHRGKVRCYVPPAAVGFTVETLDTKYLDLGTEFGVEIKPDGKQELHVFDGEVRVDSLVGNQSPQTVLSGEGLQQKSDQKWEKITSDPNQFTNTVDLSRRKTTQGQKSYQAWREYREKIKADPSLVVYYDFDSQTDNPQVLKDLSKNAIDGSIIGCELSPGRWEAKTSLEFKKPSDRVRLNIPGEFGDVTMTAWLRLDGFDRLFNSIFLTDRYEDGHLHWQVKSSGEIDAGIKPADSLRRIYVTSPMLGYEDLGRWIHLAVVVDITAQTLTHYLDGGRVATFDLRIGSEPKPPGAPIPTIRFGKTELGNWRPERAYDNSPVRNLNGRIDEFAMFSRTFSDFEIRELFNQSRN